MFKWSVFICKLVLGQRNLEIAKMDINPVGAAYANVGLGMGSLNLSSTSHNITVNTEFPSPQIVSSVSVHAPPQQHVLFGPHRTENNKRGILILDHEPQGHEQVVFIEVEI